MSRIHLIENDRRMVRVEGTTWECGYWVVGADTADKLVGGSIYFHAKQSSPSYFGGKILSWRIQQKGEFRGKVVFCFESSPTFKGLLAGRGWGAGSKVVLKD